MMEERNNHINLICFPYAGGSRYSYSCLQSAVSTNFNILPFELPGRGDRMEEPLMVDINQMADDLLTQIRDSIRSPYALYGHSMGAVLAYLVTCRISMTGLPLPLHLFVSGSEGPAAMKSQQLRSDLPHDEFIRELRLLGGIPEEVLNDKAVLRFFEPILRADLKAMEGYVHKQTAALRVPVSVAYGSGEELTREDVNAWRHESVFPLDIFVFPGDHFFIFRHGCEIVEMIRKKITDKTHQSF